jgi:hypothetical protein
MWSFLRTHFLPSLSGTMACGLRPTLQMGRHFSGRVCRRPVMHSTISVTGLNVDRFAFSVSICRCNGVKLDHLRLPHSVLMTNPAHAGQDPAFWCGFCQSLARRLVETGSQYVCCFNSCLFHFPRVLKILGLRVSATSFLLSKGCTDLGV